MIYLYLQAHKFQQKGAVLVMSLVLLTVLTLIGLASMSGSSMQMRVASNMQQHDRVFQAAQSRIAYTMSPTSGPNGTGAINFKINIPSSGPPPVQYCNSGSSCPNVTDPVGTTSTASIIYIGCTSGFGNSLEAGKSVMLRTFEIDVTSTLTNGYGIARSVQRQGVLGTVKTC